MTDILPPLGADVPESEVRDTETAPAPDTINRPTREVSRSDAEALLPLPSIAPTRDDRDIPLLIPGSGRTGVPRGPSRTGTMEGPVLARDRDIVRAVVLHRLLSYQQLQRLLFAGTHRAVAGRRLQALEAAGWLRLWEERVARGGHPRYALPTKQALLWARQVLLGETEAASHGRIVATMLRDRSPEPLPLDDMIPPFLPHQRETNDLLLALRGAALPIAWTSSWHRPLPNAIGHRPLPQPDGVIVLSAADGERLLFLEHDRGREPAGTFQAAKAERYAALKHTLADLQALTGFRSFEVLVTVHADDPLARIAVLQQAVRATYGASMFRFTVDTWLLDAPAGAIWFDASHRPEPARDRADQSGLLPLPGCTAVAPGANAAPQPHAPQHPA